MRRALRPRPWLLALFLTAFVLGSNGCTTPAGLGPSADDYLRYVWVEVPVNEKVLLRWSARQMPLRVHLPPPPPDIASDPQAVHDVVRDGVLDWTGAAGPDLPRFTFVDDPGDADIPIVWEREPSGDWYGAYCALDIDPLTRRFGVAHILVTTRARNGDELSFDWLYLIMLHEMGHALGLIGHSPNPGDIMYGSRLAAEGLSTRDRETLRRLYGKPIGTRVVGARSADR